MSPLELSLTYWWLVAGAVFMGVEAMGISGVGFLFAGLAAILVAALTQFGMVGSENLIGQFAWFFGFTFAIALLLWKPLKRWRTTASSGQEYNNMVGTSATVATGGLTKTKIGSVYWSGTTMHALLAPEAPMDMLEEGHLVEIVIVKGNQLIVMPK